MEGFTFYFFATCAVLGAALVALLPKLVHSAFALVLTLTGVAGLYWTLGADFLGAVQLLIYVGGIMILFLYGIMLTPTEETRWKFTSLVLPGAICALPVAVLLHLGWTGLDAAVEFQTTLEEAQPTTETIGYWFLDREKYLIPFELASLVLLVALVGSVYLARRRKEA